MSRCPKFAIGGAIHLVVNNQIGFTTEPQNGRCVMLHLIFRMKFDKINRYFTLLGHNYFLGRHAFVPIWPKLSQRPLSTLMENTQKCVPYVSCYYLTCFQTQEVFKAAMLALEYKTTFCKDVFVDLQCYRRRGHNELDDPSFTQPLLYDKIQTTTPVPNAFADMLMVNIVTMYKVYVSFSARNFQSNGVISKSDVDSWLTDCAKRWEDDFANSADFTPQVTIILSNIFCLLC